MGNHAYTKKDALELLETGNICRPANYGPGAKGKEFVTVDVQRQEDHRDQSARSGLHARPDRQSVHKNRRITRPTLNSDYVIVDFHAEATSEKYCDGLTIWTAASTP
ncbi:MAG: YmdB family metallophosphoesterase [Bacillus subtilis]|nr:YmdB family metallophosphoesterase [Bacillus subtilis]